MNILLSLISSGALKWLSILILVGGLVSGLYMKHRQIVNLEKQVALQQYNINQLEQNVKDKDLFIEHQQTIFKNRDEAVEKLESQKQALENKLKAIESHVDVEVGKGNDRPSSDILKETIKRLSE
jgi:predicted Holliday junction resolvase-like endonuclease